jgi:hypothetical protein
VAVTQPNTKLTHRHHLLLWVVEILHA